jgi:ribosome-associated toxin RatA of RatAB toxin-antitoxin module
MGRLNQTHIWLCLLVLLTVKPTYSLPLSSAPADSGVTASIDMRDSQPCTEVKIPLKQTNVRDLNEARVEKKSNPSKESEHLPEDTLNATINAPAEHVWTVLADFSNYPHIFDRVKSVSITKRDGDLVYIESRLKPHLFVGQEVQHTVNDLSGKPGALKWQLLDGNFKHVDGLWEIKPAGDHSCKVTYTLKVDPGPFIPGKMVSFLLHFVEKEVVVSLKRYAEKTYTASAQQNYHLSYQK